MNPPEEHPHNPPLAITIGRQLGSGGTELGRRIATRLGAAYLDQEILQVAARHLGVAHQNLADRAERVSSFWQRLIGVFAMGGPDETYTYPQRSEVIASIPDEQLFEAQSRAMRELVQQGDSVVIGHAGFHVLRDHGCHVKVFVHARAELRAERISRERGLTIAEARALLRKADDDRRVFIQRISGCDWMNVRNYDLSIDTGRVSSELAQEMIVQAVEERRGQCAARS